MSQFFRKISLERLASPEQLDYLLSIVSVRGWIALVTFAAICLSAIIWAVFATIPVVVEGKGILFDPGRLQPLRTSAAGVLKEMRVEIGEKVAAGTVLVTLEDRSLQGRIRELEERMVAQEKRVELHEVTLEKQRTALQLRLELSELLLQQKQKERSELADQASAEAKLEAEMAVAAAQEKIAVLGQQLAMLAEDGERYAMEQVLSAMRQELEELKGDRQELQIVAPEAGRVMEVEQWPGDSVVEGTTILWFEQARRSDEPQLFYALFPLDTGEKIKVGMPAQITLASVNVQKYGKLRGEVQEVLPYTAQLSISQLHAVPSEALQHYLLNPTTSVLIAIALIPDAATASGYSWTSPQGPSFVPLLGTAGNVEVTLENIHPISYLIPHE